MATPLDHLDWDDLKIFLRAVRTKSVTGAARQIGVSHSTVSRRLTRLEYAVGAALFERCRDGLALTGVGTIVMRRAEEMELGVNSLRSDMGSRDEIRGTVRLATMEGIASLYLSSRMNSILTKHPNLLIELVTSPQTVRVARREADLFLSFFKPQGATLTSERIGQFATGLYATRSYLEAHGMPLEPNDLRRHKFVGYVEELVQLETVRWLEELVPAPNLQFTSNSMIAQLFASSGGAGIVALPAFAQALDAGLVNILPQLRGRRDLWLSVHQDMANVSRIRAVSKFLRDLIRPTKTS
ncbi:MULTISPECIES: LysR family transcriptional regulator [unclassified Mesorhizobium]|uniref:LysR family transcriptional regulator n=1 Tax=unclassified Mesorhizobium TaxID=325217 RepID=UPI000FCAFCF2|nr:MULTISPECIES: LysR family transcriptional regulator [unclassified Mesorhizobium]RUV26207.1 LysR family transcriptional regulator [Mesorhizobium sp. M1A.F.Ca.IN.022.04.1.1]RWG37192.1 MAG: LysR family transcriptional regulator [Mesorhizobium sp.]TIS17684.1 MAG: LysR family transcriptional regulator [Mesorhizobium sp.]